MENCSVVELFVSCCVFRDDLFQLYDDLPVSGRYGMKLILEIKLKTKNQLCIFFNKSLNEYKIRNTFILCITHL